jgi:Spy/CpxP family protein refolding chaperone
MMLKQQFSWAAGVALVAVMTAAVVSSAGQDNRPFPRAGQGPDGRGPGPGGRFGGPGRGGPGGPMRGPGGPLGFPIQALDLSEAQRQQVREILDANQEALRPLHERAFAAHQALEAAIMADAVDEATIRARSAEVAAVEADVAVARAGLVSKVFQILTPEQKARARAMQQEAAARRPGPPRGF